ncbi:MAG: OsmC family protein [Verrucomicrobiales bacterium]|nr:OsmC family protein [Verrucomicrobiales bacterium]
MSEHHATISWERKDAPFLDQRYSRVHEWRFDGGAVVTASSSPSVVPVPMSDASAVDPEEAFVAALSSCHLLWFLSLAAKRGWLVDAYTDTASGVLGRNSEGRLAMTQVVLRPFVTFSGAMRPSPDDFLKAHHAAHDACFIASSVRTEVRVEPELR